MESGISKIIVYDGNIIAGFYASRTHSIIPVKDFMLGVAENREILEVVVLLNIFILLTASAQKIENLVELKQQSENRLFHRLAPD